MDNKRNLLLLSKFARNLFLGGGILLTLVFIAFAATAVYETVYPPTDMHLPGLFTAVMMLYVAPVGGLLIVIGCLMWVGKFLATRLSKRGRTDIEL